MEYLHHLTLGFHVAFSLTNLLYCLFGVFLGTVIGMLPGLGSATGVALLLPVALTLQPVTALIMLAGIYYGTQYGASISSILISTPGDPANVVTILDGYPLAQQGRAGPALAISACSHFMSGMISLIGLVFLAPLFASFALNFGPPEICSLVVLGFVSLTGFGSGSRAKGLAMTALGVVIAMIGLDPQSGVPRFTFGEVQLLGGIGFVPVVIGLFAVGEVMNQVGVTLGEPIRARFRDMVPSVNDLRRCWATIIRSGVLGFLIGVLPGAGATIASFFGYDVARRFSKYKDDFGKGAIEGVAAPEAANSAAVNGAFVPTLTLGIPGSATTAVLLGAFLVFGIQPGPLLFTQQPALVWGLICSFYLGSVMLFVFNLPLVPVFASVLRLRYSLLYPVILLLSFIGAFAIENRMWGVWVAFAFSILGYILKRYGYPPAPLILGLILGDLFETSFVRSVSIGGSFAIFVERPISLGLLAFACLILFWPWLLRAFKKVLRIMPTTPRILS
jgi:putative tricarboxylic transport membrane protein